MYIITIDNDFMYGTGIYERPGYEIVNPKVALSVNSAGSFTFTMYPDHPCYDSIDDAMRIVKVEKAGVSEPLFRGRVLSSEYGFYNEKTVTCEGELAFLCDAIQRPGGASAPITYLLNMFLSTYNSTSIDSKHKLELGNVTVTSDGNVEYMEESHISVYEAMQKHLIGRLGGYLYVRHENGHNYVDYLAQPFETSSQKIEFGENLLSIKKNIDIENIATVVIPLGKQKDGSTSRYNIKNYNPYNEPDPDIIHDKATDYMYSLSGINQYGWIEKALVYDDVHAVPLLYSGGKAFLKQMGKAVSIDLTAADLSGVKQDIESFKIGQYVRVNSIPHNLNDEVFIVSKLDINLTNPAANKLTLGTETAMITSQVSGSSTISNVSYSGGGSGGNYDPAGSASVALQDAKDYTDTEVADAVTSAKNYADGRDAEFLAVSADYAEEKALQAQQAAQAYADSLVYTHPAYTARDVNKVSGTQQITPGTPFTLAWFSVDNTGHVYQSGSSYFNIEPYVHPTYAEKDIGRETGVKQLTPGTTFTLPWVHVDNKGHVSQSGSSTYNISHDSDKVNTSDYESYQEIINTSISEIGAEIDGINSDISTLSTGKANKVHSHSEYLEKTASEFTGNSATATSATKLQTPRTIDGVEFDGTANISHYGVCSTAAATAAKVVSCPGFTLVTGAVIHIKFASGNSADNITLNVNGTGAKPVYQFNAAMTTLNLKFYAGNVYDFVYDGTAYQCVNDQRYVWQHNTTTSANYRLSLASTADDESGISYVRKSSKFTANPATGVLTAEEFKHSASGTVLVDTSANANSVAITNAEIAKYSTVYMSASWTESETVKFCDIIPVADIIAGAEFTKTIVTGTRRYAYSVTCTSAGLFTLTESNSTSTAGTLRLKLYVI